MVVVVVVAGVSKEARPETHTPEAGKKVERGTKDDERAAKCANNNAQKWTIRGGGGGGEEYTFTMQQQ